MRDLSRHSVANCLFAHTRTWPVLDIIFQILTKTAKPMKIVSRNLRSFTTSCLSNTDDYPRVVM